MCLEAWNTYEKITAFSPLYFSGKIKLKPTYINANVSAAVLIMNSSTVVN